jgi:Tfp pilus assembly protein PilF
MIPKPLPTGGMAGLPFPAAGGTGLAGGAAPAMFGDGGDDHDISLLYRRPGYANDDSFFFDLVGHCPGLNTSAADVQAVVEAEAMPGPRSKAGTIEDAARALFDKARPNGWLSLEMPAADGHPACTVVFDGTDRYVYERVLPAGMRERVVCDGKAILHLYADLGLGARRSVSRFQRLDFARTVPWALPAAEDLARGADLKVIAERTIAVVPHGAANAKGADDKPLPYEQLQFVFAADGRLAERQVVEMPSRKVLLREVIDANGGVRLLDGDGKELSARKSTLRPGKAPDLTPDLSKLVVLPLPYRSHEHVVRTLKLEKIAPNAMRFEDGLALLAADFAAGKGDQAANTFRQCFRDRDQRQLGFFVLLAACGQNLDGEHLDVLADHLHEPLAQYLGLYSSPVLRKHASQWAVASNQWGEGYLNRLAVSHALYQRWLNAKAFGGSDAQRQAERDRALEYVKRHKGTAFGWALLGLIQDRTRQDEEAKKDVQGVHKALAEAWLLFEDVPALTYPARYEHARSLWKSGQKEQARKQFRTLYEKALKDGALPALDADFRQALLGDDKDVDEWGALLRRTAARLIEEKHRAAVLTLAAQCRQLGDEPMANHLRAAALEGVSDDKERLTLTLAAIHDLRDGGEYAEADALLRKVLADPKQAARADLWRLAGELASRRDMRARELECLEKALDAEYQSPPEVTDLRQVRSEYEQLLTHYQELAESLVTLQLKAPPDFVARVVRAADRWRALDNNNPQACTLAGRALQTLGEPELVWDYLTTPVGLRPNEAGPWAELAQTLSRRGELALADRSYKAAFEAEPTNAQLLWDRAQNLRQAGRLDEAQKLLRQLAEGSWQPRFQGLQTQARWQLERR